MTAYHFRDGADFDSRCAPRNGGPTPTRVSSAYKISSGGSLLRDRYASTVTGPSALSVFGESGFYSESGGNNYEVAGRLAAINRNAVNANVPSAYSIAPPSYSAFASITFMNDGRIRRTVGDSSAPSTTTYPANWGGSNVSGGGFQVRFTLLSGNVSGSFGTWLSLSSGRGVSCSAGPGDSQFGSIKVEWRYGSSGHIFSDTFQVEARSGLM